MDAKYKVGEIVIINLDNEIIDAEVFGIVNSNSGGKPSYSLRVKGNFIFMNEDRIISISHD
jgi:hypothetical protein